MDKILVCDKCNKEYTVNNITWKQARSRKKIYGSSNYCSWECKGWKPSQTVKCSHCEKEFSKLYSEIKKSTNHFCSTTCAGYFNNKLRTRGFRRSKLEIWLEDKLTLMYPDLDIQYNKKDAINSELDFYFPTLNLAIELNGIFHYEPIHGEETLEKIQNNDSRKFAACREAGISLCIVDSSTLKYFKEKNCLKYLEIFQEILLMNGVSPSVKVQPSKEPLG